MQNSIVERLQSIKAIAETMRDRDLTLRVHELMQEVERLKNAIQERSFGPGKPTDCDYCINALEILEGLR